MHACVQLIIVGRSLMSLQVMLTMAREGCMLEDLSLQGTLQIA